MSIETAILVLNILSTVLCVAGGLIGFFCRMFENTPSLYERIFKGKQ